MALGALPVLIMLPEDLLHLRKDVLVNHGFVAIIPLRAPISRLQGIADVKPDASYNRAIGGADCLDKQSAKVYTGRYVLVGQCRGTIAPVPVYEFLVDHLEGGQNGIEDLDAEYHA